jgi:hypothetical protein
MRILATLLGFLGRWGLLEFHLIENRVEWMHPLCLIDESLSKNRYGFFGQCAFVVVRRTAIAS